MPFEIIITPPTFNINQLLFLNLDTMNTEYVSGRTCLGTFKEVLKELNEGLVLSSGSLKTLGDKCVKYMDKVVEEEQIVDSEIETLCSEIKAATDTMIKKINTLSRKRRRSPTACL